MILNSEDEDPGSKLILNVPFTVNPNNWQCIHSAMTGVMKHFIKESYSPCFLDALMNEHPKMWVWPSQALMTLDNEGVFARLFSKKLSSELINDYPQDYARLTDAKSFNDSINYALSNNLFEKRILSINDLEEFLRKGCVPIVLLDSNKKLGKYAIVTGFDSRNIYFHDSGPENPLANKRLSKNDFMNLWDNSMTLVAFGKKLGNSYSRFNF